MNERLYDGSTKSQTYVKVILIEIVPHCGIENAEHKAENVIAAEHTEKANRLLNKTRIVYEFPGEKCGRGKSVVYE